MDEKKYLEVIGIYRKHFENRDIPKVDFPHDQLPGTPQEILMHCHGMLDKMEKFIEEGRLSKVDRWLGFIQGCSWSTNQFILEDLKNHNRPDTKEKQS